MKGEGKSLRLREEVKPFVSNYTTLRHIGVRLTHVGLSQCTLLLYNCNTLVVS
jgi:hypothetical protein